MAEPLALEVLKVEQPCPLHWENLRGSDEVRHCGLCNTHVHNVSVLTAKQAEALLSRTDVHCVKFERTALGKVVTLDYRSSFGRRSSKSGWVVLAMIGGALVGTLELLWGGHPKVLRTQTTMGVMCPRVSRTTTMPASQPVSAAPDRLVTPAKLAASADPRLIQEPK